MKSEIRNPKSEGNPKSEYRIAIIATVSDFGIRLSFGFRISAFGFPPP
jgi:hypothetical protein